MHHRPTPTPTQASSPSPPRRCISFAATRGSAGVAEQASALVRPVVRAASRTSLTDRSPPIPPQTRPVVGRSEPHEIEVACGVSARTETKNSLTYLLGMSGEGLLPDPSTQELSFSCGGCAAAHEGVLCSRELRRHLPPCLPRLPARGRTRRPRKRFAHRSASLRCSASGRHVPSASARLSF